MYISGPASSSVIIIHKHRSIITSRQLTLTQYYLLIHSIIQMFPIFSLMPLFWFTVQSRIPPCIWCHVSLISFSMWQFLSLSLSCNTLKLLQSSDHLIGKMYNLCLSVVFSWLKIMHFWQKYSRSVCPSQYITLGGTRHQYYVLQRRSLLFFIIFIL